MSRFTLDRKVRRGGDVVWRELDGEEVLVNLARGTCFTLDPVGTRIWQLIGEHGTLSRVAGALIAEFDVDEKLVERDLLAL
ncbi:MAG: PqqD family protein, partial [Candidatus Binatia bacterium]